MNQGKTIFSQLLDFLPTYEFRQCVKRYQGHYKIKSFSCWDQFLCMAFAQLTYRESLRDLNLLGAGTPEEVEEEVRGLIRDVAPGGGYIVTSGNSLAGYLKPENALALSRAVLKYGRYPIVP